MPHNPLLEERVRQRPGRSRKLAAPAYWAGKIHAFECACDDMSPFAEYIREVVDRAYEPAGIFREGFGYRESKVDAGKLVFPFGAAWRIAMEIDVVASEAALLSQEAIEKLKETVDAFRATVKNDLASMKAGSDRVQSEVAQMTAAYQRAVSLLTGADFAAAVQNAERLGAALERIRELSDTKLSVAIFNGGTTPNRAQPGESHDR